MGGRERRETDVGWDGKGPLPNLGVASGRNKGADKDQVSTASKKGNASQLVSCLCVQGPSVLPW